MVTPQEDFTAWTEQRYVLIDRMFRCRRCWQQVGYLTKHAAERHGDPIDVMPVVDGHQHLADAY